MGVESSIWSALELRVASLATSPALPLAWPNNIATLSPPYLRIDLFRNSNRRLFLRGADPHFRQGILQLTVVMPLNRGPAPGLALADQVAAHFPADLAMFSGGLKVRVQAAPDVLSAIKEDATWDVPVSIRFEVFA